MAQRDYLEAIQNEEVRRIMVQYLRITEIVRDECEKK